MAMLIPGFATGSVLLSDIVVCYVGLSLSLSLTLTVSDSL